MRYRLASNTGQFVSDLTGRSQGTRRSGSRWEFDVQFHLIDDSTARDWRGFLAYVQDENLTFYWSFYPKGMPGNYLTSVASAGTPRVNGASQVGGSLVTDGWTGGAQLLRGDIVSFDTSLWREAHMVTADSTAGGGGTLTIPISPRIHTSPADNALILIDGHTTTAADRAACEVVLADPKQLEGALSGFQTVFNLKLIEALREV